MECNGIQPSYRTMNESLFGEYAQHLKKMIKSSSDKQNKLVGIIKKLFVFVKNPDTNNYDITVNPKLTDSSLDEIARKTRISIVELYSSCEHDYKVGIELFRKIITKIEITINPERKKSVDHSIIEGSI